MRFDYDRRIARAEELIPKHSESSELLRFYIDLTRFQKTIFNEIAGSGETDVRAVERHLPRLFELIQRIGHEQLRSATQSSLVDASAYWQGDRSASTEAQFFARVLVQPFAEALALRGTPDLQFSGVTCPFCAARPVLCVLRSEGDGARRSLLCSVCATEWQFRRVMCPNCGEENKDALPVYVLDGGYIRMDACDSCHTYLKAIDLTRDGRAVPLVDELASVSLAIWADEKGYAKLEPNLIGM